MGSIVVSVFHESSNYKINVEIYDGIRLSDFMSTSESHTLIYLLREAHNYINHHKEVHRSIVQSLASL